MDAMSEHLARATIEARIAAAEAGRRGGSSSGRDGLSAADGSASRSPVVAASGRARLRPRQPGARRRRARAFALGRARPRPRRGRAPHRRLGHRLRASRDGGHGRRRGADGPGCRRGPGGLGRLRGLATAGVRPAARPTSWTRSVLATTRGCSTCWTAGTRRTTASSAATWPDAYPPASGRCARLLDVSVREPEAARLPPSSLTVQLLGRPRIEVDGAPGYRYRSRKSWALLAFLLLGERPPTRTQLASLLFAEADDPLRSLAVVPRGDPAGARPGGRARRRPGQHHAARRHHRGRRPARPGPLDGRRRAPRPRATSCSTASPSSTPRRSSRGCCRSDDGSLPPPSRSCTRRPWGSSPAGTSAARATWPSGPP